MAAWARPGWLHIVPHPLMLSPVAIRLAAELDAAGLLASPANPRPRAMAFADLPRLTYLEAVND